MISDLTTKLELTDQGLVVQVAGELYLETAAELRETLMHVVTTGLYRRVIADLREIAIMDSSGIAALLNARKSAPAGVTDFCVLVALGSQPHRILVAAGLVKPLGVVFDLDLLPDYESAPLVA